MTEAMKQRKATPIDKSIRVLFWGVRGSYPTADPSSRDFGGNTSCVEVPPAAAV